MSNPLYRLPPYKNLRIGLFGGSFNPVHEGHLALTTMALKRLRLDHVWWLLAPQNPLKDTGETERFEHRLSLIQSVLADYPKLIVCDIEARLGTRTTAAMLAKMAPVLTQGRFVWLMGADSFAQLHQWYCWQRIPARLPLAVFDRPGYGLKALRSPAAQILHQARIMPEQAAGLPGHAAPAWCFLPMPLRHESSSQLRISRN